MMGITKSMTTVIVEIRLPVVMNRDSLELRQDLRCIHCRRTARLMKHVIGQPGCTGAVQPVSLFLNSDAGFIKINHVGCQHLSFDIFHWRLQGAGTDFLIIKVKQDFSRSFARQKMLIHQVKCLGFNPRTILNRLCYRVRKGCLVGRMTMRTGFNFRLIFSHFNG